MYGKNQSFTEEVEQIFRKISMSGIGEQNQLLTMKKMKVSKV